MKFGVTRGLIVLGITSFTHVALAQEAYPVLRPNKCETNIIVPKGENGDYLLSKDCKTVFVLPRTVSPLEVTAFSLTEDVNESNCRRVRKMESTLDEIENNINSLRSMAFMRATQVTLTASEEAQKELAIANLKKHADEFQIIYDKKAKKEPFSGMDGAILNLHLGLDLDSSISAFQKANKGNGLIFRAAPIYSGILSYNFKESVGADKSSIIKASISGLAPGENMFSQPGHLFLAGGVGGYVILSQPTACAILRDKELASDDPARFNYQDVGLKDMALAFGATYTYEVPVTADIKFKFDAQIKSENLQGAWNSKTQKAEYSQDDISEMIYNGSMRNDLHITYDDGGKPFDILIEDLKKDERTNVKESNVFNYLLGNALDSYLDAVLEKMKVLKLIIETAKTKSTPMDGKVVFDRRTLQDCRWKTAWGKTRKKCSSYVVEDRKFVEGVTNAKNVTIDNMSQAFEWKIELQQTMTLKKTTGFSLQTSSREVSNGL